MKYITAINSLGAIANVICVFLYVRGPSDYIFVPLFNSLFCLVAGIWGLYVAFKKFELEFVFQTYKDIKRELKASWSVFTSIVAINAYTATRILCLWPAYQ